MEFVEERELGPTRNSDGKTGSRSLLTSTTIMDRAAAPSDYMNFSIFMSEVGAHLSAAGAGSDPGLAWRC